MARALLAAELWYVDSLFERVVNAAQGTEANRCCSLRSCRGCRLQRRARRDVQF